MSLYSQWLEILHDRDSASAKETVKRYYEAETEAYNRILAHPDDAWSGTAAELADRLGFGKEMVIFLGFLDGLQTSLETPLNLEETERETDLVLKIDYRQLYWRMHEAKADWLYNLKSWNNILSEDDRRIISREYRDSKIVRVEKTGRNDPCPCGSGKKYKNCCGRG